MEVIAHWKKDTTKLDFDKELGIERGRCRIKGNTLESRVNSIGRCDRVTMGPYD
jgi:hypothetical protein